jgi:hypothetical protein
VCDKPPPPTPEEVPAEAEMEDPEKEKVRARPGAAAAAARRDGGLLPAAEEPLGLSATLPKESARARGVEDLPGGVGRAAALGDCFCGD